jgi:hypothetical protein
MANKIITVHFTTNGAAVIGLSPTIDVYELDTTNPTTNTLVVDNGIVTEIGLGWYRYDFITYNPTKNYVYTFDGGISLPNYERYKIGGNESYVEEISSGVWEEPTLNHLTTGSTGFALTQIKSTTEAVMVSQGTISLLLNTLLKYERNRTRIDIPTATLTIYDNDGTTVLTKFSLKDHLGNPSVAEVCERMPI